MEEERFRRNRTNETYMRLYEEEKKALKIINKRAREQSKEIRGLRAENTKLKHMFKSLKVNLVGIDWDKLTLEDLKELVDKLLKIINRRKE